MREVRERGWPAGPQSKKRKGDAQGGLGLARRKRERGKRIFPFYFLNPFFKHIFKLKFEQI